MVPKPRQPNIREESLLDEASRRIQELIIERDSLKQQVSDLSAAFRSSNSLISEACANFNSAIEPGRLVEAIRGLHAEISTLASRHVGISAALQSAQASNAVLFDVVGKCCLQFALYTRNHMAKSPPDISKAKANRQYAEMCAEALGCEIVGDLAETRIKVKDALAHNMEVAVTSGHMQVLLGPSPVVSPHSAGVFPKPEEEEKGEKS